MKNRISGEVFILASGIAWGLFPLITNFGAKRMPPVWYAAVISLLSGIVLFGYLAKKKGLPELLIKKVWPWILGVTLFVVIIPNFLIFTSATYTSGINTTILLQTEVISTFLFCWIFLGEKITRRKIIGALVVFLGALAILYRGNFELNLGDVLIVGATACYPFGNFCAKKALQTVSPATILCMRQFFGGLFLLAISFFMEDWSGTSVLWKQNAGIILINGILIMAISRVWWYEGLQRVSLTTAASLGGATPAFGMLFAIFFFGEIPTLYQLAGFVIVMAGIFMLTKKNICNKMISIN